MSNKKRGGSQAKRTENTPRSPTTPRRVFVPELTDVTEELMRIGLRGIQFLGRTQAPRKKR